MSARVLSTLACIALLAWAMPALAGLTQFSQYTFESDVASRYLGMGSAPAGDVNGDGFSDFVALGTTGSNSVLYLFFGGSAGFTLASGFPVTLSGAASAIGPAGDVDGDGHSDVVLGFATPSNGAIRVFRGTASGLDMAHPFIQAETFVEGFGSVVGTAGDVDNDGRDEVIVGSPDDDGSLFFCGSSRPSSGRVDVFYGSATGLSSTARWTLFGCQWVPSNSGAALGTAATTAGDVNGDGFDDILIGAPGARVGGTDAGKAFVVYGSASRLPLVPGFSDVGTLVGSTTVESPANLALFGVAAIPAGDVNGDGFADIAVGAPYDDTSANDGGMVRVYLGGPDSLRSAIFWSRGGPFSNTFFGNRLAPAGDVNGDGLGDLLAGDGFSFALVQSARTSMTYGQAYFANMYNRSFCTAGDVDGDGLSDVVDGLGYWTNGEANEGHVSIYCGRGDGPQTVAGWSPTTGEAGINFGWSVSSAGDVNGDGVDDMLIGAPTWDLTPGVETDDGAIYLQYGGAGAPFGAATRLAHGAPGEQLGIAVSAAGDINGDGYADIVAGGHQGGNGNGKIRVWYGRNGGIPQDSPANVVIDGYGAGSQFGAALAWGDVNGDGYADVAVGAPFEDAVVVTLVYPDGGRAYVYLGGSGGLSIAPAWIGQLAQNDAHFGSSLTMSGDITGDGYTDLVVGAPGFDTPGAPFGIVDAGGVFEYDGSSAAMPLTFRQRINGGASASSEIFGNSVGHAGDVNGDGFADIIVGAPFATNTLSSQGRASVFTGSASGLVATPLWTQYGDEASGAFGSSVSGAGDINGDGLSDVLVGAVFQEAGGVFDRGAARVYLGPLPASAPAAWTATGAGVASNLGHVVANAGDVDGDGWSDLIFGEPGFSDVQFRQGLVQMFRGARGLGSFTLTAALNSGYAIHPLGRTEPTQFTMFQLGRSAAGRTHVKLQWRVQPVVGLMSADLSGGQSSFTQTGAPGFFGSVIFVAAPVGGLHQGMPYSWRLRSLARSVYFPTTPWISGVRNGAREYDLRVPGLVAVGDLPDVGGDLALAAPWPNPSFGSSAVSFALPAPGHVQLDIFDIHGGRVRRLLDVNRPAGPQLARWDGRADGGTDVAAGVYFYRLEYAGIRLSRRIALVR